MGDVVEANEHNHPLERIGGAGGPSHDYGCVALARVPQGAGNCDAYPRSNCRLSVPWLRLGPCLPHRVIMNPGAFDAAGSKLSLATSWVNYSFGMLTTVGYGGIVPVHPLAHSLGSAEAVTGQLYLAVLVARLVSMQVSATEDRGR